MYHVGGAPAAGVAVGARRTHGAAGAGGGGDSSLGRQARPQPRAARRLARYLGGACCRSPRGVARGARAHAGPPAAGVAVGRGGARRARRRPWQRRGLQVRKSGCRAGVRGGPAGVIAPRPAQVSGLCERRPSRARPRGAPRGGCSAAGLGSAASGSSQRRMSRRRARRAGGGDPSTPCTGCRPLRAPPEPCTTTSRPGIGALTCERHAAPALAGERSNSIRFDSRFARIDRIASTW